jgi:hypothetical protein
VRTPQQKRDLNREVVDPSWHLRTSAPTVAALTKIAATVADEVANRPAGSGTLRHAAIYSLVSGVLIGSHQLLGQTLGNICQNHRNFAETPD